MDEDAMDFDFVLNSDPIREFLQRKLEEIRHANGKLAKQIEEKEKLLQECISMTADLTDDGLHVVHESWKKIHGNQCVIGIRLKNSGNEFVMVENVILNWTSSSSSPITYRTKIFENDADVLEDFPVSTTEIKKSALLLLSIEKPDFSRQITYDVNGIVLYSGDRTETKRRQRQMILENVRIDADDFSDRSLQINSEDVSNRRVESILTCLVAKEEFRLVSDRDIAEGLRDSCAYREIDFNRPNRKLFLIDNSTGDVDGNLIEISENSDDYFDVNIVCLNEDVLLQILHHIYGKIDDLFILPKSHEICLHRLNVSPVKSEADRDKFAESLWKQLHFIRDFYKGKVKECGAKNYVDFRSRLNELQLETDLLYLKCCSNV